MRRLNNARNNLKHSGIMVASAEIEGFRASVTNFLYENSSLVFGLDFSSISMAGLVTSTEVRQHLESAEAALVNDKLDECLSEAALSFSLIMTTYHSRSSRNPFTRSAFGFLQEISSISDFAQYARRAVDDINNAFRHLSNTFGEAITIVAHGIDFESYLLFKTYAPPVLRFADGHVEVQIFRSPPEREIVESCVRFVIDAAVRLQAAA